MRPHEPSVVIAAGRSQPPTGNEFVVPPGNTAVDFSHQCSSVFIRGSPPKVNRFQDAQPLQTGLNGRHATNAQTDREPNNCCHAPRREREKVALDFAVVSLACRTLGPGKIIAEAQKRRDAEEYGDT